MKEKRKRTRPRVSEIAPLAAGKPPKFGGQLLVRGIPESTHRIFKAACVNRDVTMRDAFIIIMRRFAAAVEKGQDTIRIDRLKKEPCRDESFWQKEYVEQTR